jgi:hypothetical protein
MPSTVDYAAALDIQHFVVPLRMASVVLEDAAAAAANGGSTLSTWLNTANAISGTGSVIASGSGTTFNLQVNGASRTITNAALASNVATLTLSAAAGATATVGSTINVFGLPAPFASLNGAFVITAVTTSAPFTVSYALNGTTIASAAVTAGTVTVGGNYALDGTGAPIQLLNVTGAPLSTQEADEKVLTHDQVTRGASISIGISNDSSIAFKGMTVHKSIDHKIMEIFRQFGVAEKLAVKYLRVGPGGTTERKLCYGRITSKQEEGDAGALVKYGASMTVLGQVYNVFDNT